MARARGCLLAAAAVAALGAVALAVLAPTLWRQGRRLVGPISEMRKAEADVEALVEQHPWREPETPTLTAEQLDRFLGVRRELHRLYTETEFDLRDLEGRERPSFGEVAGILQGVGEVVSRQTRIFVEAKLNPAEYRYLERLVYRRWRPALRASEADPGALARAATEIEAAAGGEREPAVAARLRALAEELRARSAPAPEGTPPEIHALLLARLGDIERYSLDEFGEMPLPDAR